MSVTHKRQRDGFVQPIGGKLHEESMVVQSTLSGQAATRVRLERHFDDRVVRCFEHRWPNITAMFLDSAARRAGEEAVVCESRRLDWQQLADQVARVAGGLAERGVAAGERVALLLGNDVEFVVASFAVSMLGAVLVPINTREQTPGLTHILNDSGAAALLYDAALAPKLPAAPHVPGLRIRVCVGDSDQTDAFDRLLAAQPLARQVPVGEEEVALIMYTSGTTGVPKGAALTHMNVIHSVLHYKHAFELTEQDRGCVTVPLSHVTGLVALMLAVMGNGGTLLIDPRFQAKEFLALAEQERMTYTLMVPAMYNLCLMDSTFAKRNLSSWRIGAFGGSPMHESAIDKLANIVPGLGLFNVYGSTETASPTVIMPAGQTASHVESVGRPLLCTEVTVMDENGRELPVGEVGELWLKGPNVVRGYWNNLPASIENFCAGYWRSGDIGRVDEQGFVYLMDRRKDVINRGGYKIYSAEVENVIARMPGVLEVAAVAKPCPVLCERVHVFVTLADGADLDQEDIRSFCAERLSDYKVPETCTIARQPLPRNAMGKILKRELREKLLALL